MDLLDYHLTPLHQLYERVRELAAARGIAVAANVVVGLLPTAALALTAAHYYCLTRFGPTACSRAACSRRCWRRRPVAGMLDEAAQTEYFRGLGDRAASGVRGHSAGTSGPRAGCFEEGRRYSRRLAGTGRESDGAESAIGGGKSNGNATRSVTA